jgi:hypothetical protein
MIGKTFNRKGRKVRRELLELSAGKPEFNQDSSRSLRFAISAFFAVKGF